MYILSQLFRELPSLNARISREDSEYRRLSTLVNEAYDRFSRDFSEEAEAHFKTFADADQSMTAIEAEDCFIEGFLLGARIMLAVTGEYRGQFKPLDPASDPAT